MKFHLIIAAFNCSREVSRQNRAVLGDIDHALRILLSMYRRMRIAVLTF